ncbi:FmtA-like protein, putative [Streptococcus sanguinis SK36]|uniref:FmtA-like protein, putative n=1 Tax=Streptococcus sanguinis (strain SK36) TaxID=388919 RepID=A3CNL2_STRSV|nr:serine hydrolase domain-containing protein [Streptococcus sanguinis]ABN44767.1 FmtA-like protein, putative [Streptococcus sanguinis SK36]MBZ2054874.1 beta-lactamase family protein [Streptococcus sanguinis]
MKKSFILTLLTIITLGIFRPSAALADSQKLPSGTDRSQIGQKIQDFVKEHEKTTAGMATAVFDKNGTIYKGNFGYVDKENKVKVDDDSVFEWASITKLTVWVSVMQLWEEGKIDLEADIKTYLPEGFLRNLRYDKPITMLDLMNHQAGFDEMPLYKKGDKSDLEEQFRDYQPIQSFEPGTTTSYSNYSTALASYIVERISGQKYADYVHEHVFEPLDMDRTAILPDLSDNAYVQEKRKEDKGYDDQGKLLGDTPFKLWMYPVGGAVGTLGDLQKFAQALLERKTLFHHPETWTELYSTTSTHPGTDIVRNAHGFWASHYSVTLLGHSGNSNGFSSNLYLDLENGIGQVILTNQQYELIYNMQMPELIFGKMQTVSEETKKQFSPGSYRYLGSYNNGPLSILLMMPGTIMKIGKLTDQPGLLTTFWTIDQSQGADRIEVGVLDAEKLSDTELFQHYLVLILGALGLVFALGNVLISSLIGGFRLILRKARSSAPRSWKIWNYLTSIGIILFGGNLILFLLSAMNPFQNYSMIQSWRFMAFAGLGLFLAGCAVYPLFSKARRGLGKGRLYLTILTSLSALAIVVNILYWSLYQWWVM